MAKTKGKVRVGMIMQPDVRDAMLVIRDVIRVLPSHQVDLAMREYVQQYKDLLLEHGIVVKESRYDG